MRTIPLDKRRFVLHLIGQSVWTDVKVAPKSPFISVISRVLAEDRIPNDRPDKTNDVLPFKDRVVVIGSVATGNNITDVGGTPLEPRTAAGDRAH
jgi:hypothetical protein